MSLELGDRRETLILVPQKKTWSDKLGGWLEVFLIFLVIYIVTFVLLVLVKPEWVLKPPASVATTERTNIQKQQERNPKNIIKEETGATTQNVLAANSQNTIDSLSSSKKEKKEEADTQTRFEPHLFAEELLKSLIPPKLRDAAQTVGTMLQKSVILGSGTENNFYDFWTSRILKTQYTPLWEAQEIDLSKISCYAAVPSVMFLLAVASFI